MDAVLPGLLGGTAGAGITSTVDPPAPVDRESCSLFGSTALTVQGLMALLVLTSLVIKRYREHPQRPWRVWMGDVSKQIIGQGFLHVRPDWLPLSLCALAHADRAPSSSRHI